MPWKECREHTFENLIALCPNCHARYDRGEIDRKSMRIYKVNLGLLNSRYGDFERRILDHFVLSQTQHISLPAGYRPLLSYLIKDGILGEPILDEHVGHVTSGSQVLAGTEIYKLTEFGDQFLSEYQSARELA